MFHNVNTLEKAYEYAQRYHRKVYPNTYTREGCRVIRTEYTEPGGCLMVEEITLVGPETEG